ncbi:hypothetical protein [Novosphingobium sp. Leaf2]|uniref:hypothetical protein n=1 Tax=Novosphingobium sp. Leaf2 TaxID=1735670 RepID=UPI0006F4FC09|nr:hypothetical protein [Novosphingobium sp. Leaf2]KQM21342.1 hypothetical protein ASE49_14755 [Novosphingobium sp. Leaf2]
MDKQEARAALAAAQGAADGLAQVSEAACPPWRHAAFGVVMAMMVLAAGMPLPIYAALFVLAMGGVAALAAWDRRRTGVFVNGFRRGPTLPVSLALLGGMLALVFAQVHVRENGLGIVPSLGLAGGAFVLACGASIVFQRIYLRELRKGLRP